MDFQRLERKICSIHLTQKRDLVYRRKKFWNRDTAGFENPQRVFSVTSLFATRSVNLVKG